MLHLHSVTKTFAGNLLGKKQTALDNVSFSVRPGAITGFLGANGAGKTTSIKMMLGFIRPDSGSIIYDKPDSFFQEVGYLPEHPFFYQSVTGKDFVFYMGRLSGVDNKEIEKVIEYWGKRLKIFDALEKKIRFYSKGMLQRLGVLAVLVHNPRLIILDEPLNGLDPNGRKELKEILLELHALGKTILFSSHILSDIEEICSNVIVLKSGQLFYDGDLKQLLDKHKSNNFLIKTVDNGGKYSSISTNKDEKEEVISKLINSGSKIESVTSQNPNLEEIIYARH